MSELIAAAILAGLALWGFGCHWVSNARVRRAALLNPGPRSNATLRSARRGNDLEQSRYKTAAKG